MFASNKFIVSDLISKKVHFYHNYFVRGPSRELSLVVCSQKRTLLVEGYVVFTKCEGKVKQCVLQFFYT